MQIWKPNHNILVVLGATWRSCCFLCRVPRTTNTYVMLQFSQLKCGGGSSRHSFPTKGIKQTHQKILEQ